MYAHNISYVWLFRNHILSANISKIRELWLKNVLSLTDFENSNCFAALIIDIFIKALQSKDFSEILLICVNFLVIVHELTDFSGKIHILFSGHKKYYGRITILGMGSLSCWIKRFYWWSEYFFVWCPVKAEVVIIEPGAITYHPSLIAREENSLHLQKINRKFTNYLPGDFPHLIVESKKIRIIFLQFRK